jgi:hypothetical protein
LVAVIGILAFYPAIVASRSHALPTPDFSQAEAMLDFLRSCAADKPSPQAIDHIIDLPGTDLIVKQQNISRSVTRQQYRDVLEAACGGKLAALKPAAPGTRAEKGVDGLTQDVAPSLLWGRQNIPLLESRLE